MGIAEIKSQARQALHDRAAFSAIYSDEVIDEPVPTSEQTLAGLALTVRWMNKISVQAAEGQQGSMILEGVDRVCFNQPQLTALGLTLLRNAVVECPDQGATFRLDQREPDDGPLNVYWSVTVE